ncbi:SLC13 family permease, partial [Streptomyces niveus]
TAVLTAVGAVTPAAVGIVAPIGLGFAVAYGISPVLMGLFIANGASAGGFSPIGVFGSITNNVVERNDLPGSPATLFTASFLFNVGLCVIIFLLFGGRQLLGRIATSGGKDADDEATAPASLRLDLPRALTLLGLLSLVAGALFFDLDVGLMALTISVVLTLVAPTSAKGAVDKCAWSTVLLVCGIVTYVSQMERLGTIDWLGERVASIDAPLLGALLICLIGAVVSAFASTTGMLGALIPLAVPFLLTGQVGAVGLITALAISASIVDASPFSTSGALVTANTPPDQRDLVFRRLMAWGLGIAVVGPLVTWCLFVVPGSL